MVEQIDIFMSNLSEHSSDFSISDNEYYEVRIYNIQDPSNNILSWWNIDISEKEQWWPSCEMIDMFKKYGWVIQFDD